MCEPPPSDSLDQQGIPVVARTHFAINGRSWPHTERLVGMVGDTLRWRLVNALPEVHPMHLHGFYFRVEESGSYQVHEDYPGDAGRMVVTERIWIERQKFIHSVSASYSAFHGPKPKRM